VKIIINLPAEPDDVIIITRTGDEVSVNLSSGLNEAAAFRLLKAARHTLADEGMPDDPEPSHQHDTPAEANRGNASPLILPASLHLNSAGHA